MNYIEVLEYIGVFAFAVSGAIVAIKEEYDIFGIYILATVTAMGGGVLRDVVTNADIPYFFTSYSTIPFIFLGASFAIFLKGKLKYATLFTIIDTLGLAAFFISAGSKAIDNNYNFMLFIFVSSITGVGGGILRDVLTSNKPQIFRNDVYCVAGIAGSIILWLLYGKIDVHTAQFISIISIIVIRMVCYFKKVNLPTIK